MYIRYPIERAEPERCWWAESEIEFRDRLAAQFPGFSKDQIIDGLTVPACEETT